MPGATASDRLAELAGHEAYFYASHYTGVIVRILRVRGLLLVLCLGPIGAQDRYSGMSLEVAPGGRMLVRQSDGAPVFLLGDTVWPLALRMNREDIQFYLDQRQKQGLTLC